MADEITNGTVELTPTEAFVLGGAFLIHDLGMGLAAWPGGLAELQEEDGWQDILATCIYHCTGEPPQGDDLADPPERALLMAKETALRERHASRASRLAFVTWESRASGASYQLLENTELRERYGSLIGEIAASHWWSIEEVAARFSSDEPIGAPVDCPADWTVDELKLACLMRLADAAHLDERRAPGFLRAIRAPHEYSDLHWSFQGRLQRPRLAGDRLVYTSPRAFDVTDAQAWWVCYEALQMVDLELRSVDALLAERDRPRFAAKGVRAIEEPRRLAEYIRTENWQPIDARPRINNVPGLVRQLGAERLYGEEPLVAMRELIQNARDASRALQQVLGEQSRAIQVELQESADGHWFLTVNDFGVGMSSAVLSGTLLDFGQSYWGSQLMRQEHPGLGASGFSAVGRFGIGFFSVFMLGDEVSVISRRYDAASAATQVLHFGGGVATRPILRSAEGREVRHHGGTSVSVRLRLNPFEDGGLLRHQGRQFTLDEACAYMAPAVDCDIDARVGDEPLRRVINANDWRAIPGSALLRRITERPNYDYVFGRAAAPVEEVAERLDEIVVAGEVVARASLSPVPPSIGSNDGVFQASACVAIGGFRGGGDLGGVTGIVKGMPTTADRLRYDLVPDRQAWSAWASGQAERWCDWVNAEIADGNDEAFSIPQLVLRLGGDTQAMVFAQVRSGFIDSCQFAEWARERSEIVFVPRYTVDVQSGGDDAHRVWHRDDHALIQIADNVVLSGTYGQYGSWRLYGDERPDKNFAHELTDFGRPRNARGYYYVKQLDFEGLLMRIIAEAWSVDLASVLDGLLFYGDGEAVVGHDCQDMAHMAARDGWIARRP
nr:ATP-binding protein [Ornithinimicrobium pekingense]